MSAPRNLRIALALTLALGARTASRAEPVAPERSLPLSEAVALALEHDESIVVQRETVTSAEAAIGGARGAYDPQLDVQAGWDRSALPVNSAFSGAPAGELAPTNDAKTASAGVSQLLPTGGTVKLRASAQRDTTDGLFQLLSPAYQTSLGVELRQPLLRDRAIDASRFGLRVAAADRDRAAADLRRQLTETVAAVERTYWKLTAARREVGVREEAVRLAEQQARETDERIRAGTAPESEAAQPRAELERRRGELLAARENQARTESALKLLILGDSDGAVWNDHLAPVEPGAPTIAPVDVEAAMSRALTARPELAGFQAVVERRRLEAQLAHDATRPALDAVVSYDRYGLTGTLNQAATVLPGTGGGEIPGRLVGGWGDSVAELRSGGLDDKRVGLMLSVPLGNRRARAGAVIAESAARQAAADLQHARKQVRAEVLDAAAALDTAGQRIESAKAGRQAAEVQLEAEHERYGAGMSTNFLVLTRQNDLAAARLEEISAQTDYRQAEIEMARSTGALLAERGIQVDAAQAGDQAAKEDGQ